MHIPVGIDAAGCQPVAQQQVVHRRRMHDPQRVGFAVVTLQPVAVILHGVNARIGEAFGQGHLVAIAADGEGRHDR